MADYPTHDSAFLGHSFTNSALSTSMEAPLIMILAILIRIRDLPPIFEENSCLYIFTCENLIKWHHRIGKRPKMFEIDLDEAWDIDEELDFEICDYLLSRLKKE